MHLIRIELGLDGEPMGVGFMVGISDIGISDSRAEELIRPFDRMMKIPENIYQEVKPNETSAWFTKLGFQTFEVAIKAVCQCIFAAGFSVFFHCLTRTNGLDVLYEDENQLIIRGMNLLEGNTFEVRNLRDYLHAIKNI